MENYESKQVVIRRPAQMVYDTLSDFSRFTPILQDKVEGWQADADTCTFKVKGFSVRLQIVERDPGKLVKITAPEGGAPLDFNLWLQMKQMAEDDTRFRLVLHIKLNMMMKMMIGGKIQPGLDQIAEQIAQTFNNAPI